MSNKELSTESYKGVRDFYPEDMAVQQYIFDTWSKAAENFGFARYDASILEPSELYKSKGAENEEMVNEQTYTFTDRGGREVTLRPEMTPTVARMVAGRRRELTYPLRWYSIPNLFRYERMQKGRLREHCQLNCDIFGADHYSIDVEIIALAHTIMTAFGATNEMFEIRINNRKEMRELYNSLGITEVETQTKITRLNDRFRKITTEEYLSLLKDIVGDENLATQVYSQVSATAGTQNEVQEGLAQLGITNVVVDRTLARGFDYYTGTIFEIFDVSGENNRSMLGGGRYDNLTGLFGGEPITGIGFGMGDVTMRDFLETHKLLKGISSAPALMVLPMEEVQNMSAQIIASTIRNSGVSVSVDCSTKKIGKKIADAAKAGALYTIVLGETEVTSQSYTLKNLKDGTEVSGTLDILISKLAP